MSKYSQIAKSSYLQAVFTIIYNNIRYAVKWSCKDQFESQITYNTNGVYNKWLLITNSDSNEFYRQYDNTRMIASERCQSNPRTQPKAWNHRESANLHNLSNSLNNTYYSWSLHIISWLSYQLCLVRTVFIFNILHSSVT